MAGGSLTVPHEEPELPADASTNMPDAWVFSTMACSVLAAQPSLAGQPQLLFITCGRRAGLGLFPAKSVGAMKNWKHSVYVEGVPLPTSMLRQPIHLAPGATPTWLPAP